MGGVPPLGYDVPDPGSRTQRVNHAEAVTVRHFLARYLEFGLVHALHREHAATSIVSKLHFTLTGRTTGGAAFSHGPLFHLLCNRIYLGQIVDMELVHAGTHSAIVDEAVFGAVRHLEDNTRSHQRSEKAGSFVPR